MPSYKAPIDDTMFVLYDVLKMDGYGNLPGFSDAPRDLVEAIVNEGAKFCEEVLQPLNVVGDTVGCRRNADGTVTTPPGFKEAYRLYQEGGWMGLAFDPAYGGQGLPATVNTVVGEFMSSANLAWGMYPGLTQGAMAALSVHASDAIKQIYLPKMTSGEWTGTMNLTEPHCGTDLGMLRTKAVPNGDGSYRITGQKIFISAGEHDMAENIIHLVLARIEGAPAGTKGISLFVVPKFLPTPDNKPGARNGVSCGKIEEKMGIHGNATCVMNYDEATGWVVGHENKGLNAMFVMMNEARLSVGVQGLSQSEVAYQNAVAYAKDRLQGRSLSGVKAPDKAADPIIVHPDVRRMLLTMKALNEGGRAFSSYVALQLDIAKYSEDPTTRTRAQELVSLLTPVAKAFLTDMGLETTLHGQMIFGGHGYIREWGQEQLVRDVRITQIYEGTNGIQSLDLAGRKIVGSGGALYRLFASEIRNFTANASAELDEFTQPLNAAVDTLDELTAWLLDRAQGNPNEIGAASVEYLHVFGYTAYAYMWARMAKAVVSGDAEDDFYTSKLATARFYFARLLPRIHSLSASAKAGSDCLYELQADQF